jgi:hypothetical protein
MRFQASAAVLCLAPLFVALAVPSSQSNAAAEEPRYETSSNVDIIVVISDVKNVPLGSALNGTHLLVRPESSKPNAETTDVYLAPDEYLKDFGCTFAKGNKLQVKGSKIRYNGSQLILAREVRLDSTTVYLRDDHGVPYWKKS